MSQSDDRDEVLSPPERPFYAEGVNLDASDFTAEQSYHRGRLARTLAYLHGSGTAAGLEVSYKVDKDELQVDPGLAIDPFGRLVEVPRLACINLKRWYEWNPPPEKDSGKEENWRIRRLNESWRDADGGFVRGVHAALLLRFHACPQGRTPAFAAGPYDALSATVPHRTRDSYALELRLRGTDAIPKPDNLWPTPARGQSFEDWRAAVHTRILGAWKGNEEKTPPDIFLAQVVIPTAPAPALAADAAVTLAHRPVRTVGAAVPHYEADRPFVYPTAALIRWLEGPQNA
ncbi:MAG: hypothetical protein H6739_35340 [Alphaproteobacteria bacterium]|nr:hypothetical protein [Alphaproteobacteria bacterium]